MSSTKKFPVPRAAGYTPITSLPALLDGASDRPFRQLVFRLISLSNLMRGNQERFARMIGVSLPQFTIMAVLEATPGATVGEVAARLEVSSQFVTLESRRLLEQGLIEKRPNQDDGRSLRLELTAAGRERLREVAPVRRQANDRMFRSLDGEHAALLGDMLEAILAHGREARHELDAPGLRGEAPPARQGRRTART